MEVTIILDGYLSALIKSDKNEINININARRPLEEIIDSLGIPLYMIGAAIINERFESMSYVVEDGDMIELIPFVCSGG